MKIMIFQQIQIIKFNKINYNRIKNTPNNKINKNNWKLKFVLKIKVIYKLMKIIIIIPIQNKTAEVKM